MRTVSEGIFHIDRDRDRGLQAQVRESVVAGVVGGRILPGARLPSTRKLAEYLGVSRLTVSLAYQELVSLGYLEASERSGYRISAAAPVARLRAAARDGGAGLDWSARLRRFSIAKRIRKPLDWRSYRYPFLYGQTDMSLFDLAAWRD
jgi:GntR family transcriptional regulator/MocR family aminotransferase